MLSPQQILERLDSRFHLLAQSGGSQHPRHQTLGAVLEWSASLLDAGEKRLLQRLAVFPGAWDLEAAAAMSDTGDVVAILAGLVDKSLVLADTSQTSASYRLLDSVRLFALDRLRASGDEASARDRMLHHLVALAEHIDAEWYLGHGDNGHEQLRGALANLRAALEWGLTAPSRAEHALRLATALRWFWRANGDFMEAGSSFSRALRAAEDQSSPLSGRAHIALGQAQHHLTQFADARAAIDRGLQQVDPRSLDAAWGLATKALNEALSGQHEACEAAADAALDIDVGADTDWIAATAHLALGQSHAMRGDYAAALAPMTTAHALARRAADSYLESYVATNLALMQFLNDDPVASRELFSIALRLSVRLHNPRAIAGCFEGLGYVMGASGDARLGIRLTGAAARLREITGAPLLPQWLRAHAEHQSRVEAALGTAAAAREQAAGAALPIDDLAALFVG